MNYPEHFMNKYSDMLKAIKIRIYPTPEQSYFINRQLGCCRFVYNKCLDFRKDSYEREQKSISSPDTIKHIVALKSEHEFLKEVHSKVLQQSIRDLNQAYDNFFNLHKGYPRFKSKHDNKQSCRFPKDAFMGVRGNRIDLIKSLKDIHFKCSRKDEVYLNRNQDKVHSITLTKTRSGKLYLSVLIDKPQEIKPRLDTCIGIDLGIKSFVTTSDGEFFENIHPYRNEERRLRHLNRMLSKKVKGSNNRNKIRIKIAKLNERISNRRTNNIQQITSKLVNENQVIIMEDLNSAGMLRNHKLAKHLQDCAFGEFGRILEQKCSSYGRTLVKINRFYASSKTCHHCGYANRDLKLSDRVFICPICGNVIDRDYNAALNILDEGLGMIGLSSPELKPAENPTMDDRAHCA